MSRLTFNPCDECIYSYSKNNQEMSTCKFCEFRKYLDLEEQGRLIELPCAVGDTVYKIDWEYEDSFLPETKYYYVNETKFDLWMLSIIGEWVFLTKEEAEAKLAEMEGAE